MEKMRFGIIAIIGLCLMQLVAAGIILSQPQAVYNYGDILSIKATIVADEDKAGFFELSLGCDVEKNFHRQFLNLKKSQEKQIEAEILLLPSFTNKGECKIKSSFSNEIKESQNFKISDTIDISLNAINIDTEAGKTIIISGKAKKENGNSAKGYVDLAIENSSVQVFGIANESFSLNFSFPENAKSGNYNARIKVYEKLNQEITNQGDISLIVYIKQTPKKIIIEAGESVMPGNELSLVVKILDQAEDEINDKTRIKLVNNKNKIILEKESDGEEEIAFAMNSSAGTWRIEAEYQDLKAGKEFSVLLLEKASFEIIDDTLIIRNIGNAIYKKTIEISIGDYKETKNIELDVGEKMKFKLNAPDGNYDVKVSDGTEELKINVVLTGKAIDIKEIGSGFNLIMKYPIVWIFLILVLGIFILLFSRKVIKRASYSVRVEKEAEISRPQEKKGFEVVDVAKGLEKAEHSLVLDGRKEEASLLTIKIGYMEKARRVSAETLSSLYKLITENKGSVFESGNFIIGVFSSLNTKTFRNELPAIKVARQIETLLKEHNRKFKEKIEYGIGLSLGEIIAKKDDKFRFTALGNSLNIAKRTAELAFGELLLAENIHEKVINEIRAERVVKNSVNIYSIKAIMDRDKNKEFIQGFLERQRK